MMNKTGSILILLLVLSGIWIVFRPELLFVDTSIDERFPGASAKPIVMGHFYGLAHDTRGDAIIYRRTEGKRFLRLTNFATSNGPDVHVVLVAANDATDSSSVKEAGFRSLGLMKANQGNQNYELPEEIDLLEYRAVSIWCRRFGVNFGTAPLVKYEGESF